MSIETAQYQTIFDAFGDWKQLVVTELSRLNLKFDPTDNVEDLYLKLLQYRRRTIDRRKREILEAKGFKCNSDLIAGYRILRKKIRQGKNLNINLSTRIEKLHTRDLLLNDWGIYHFHLGTPSLLKDTTFSGRTESLLFALITADIFYVIGTWTHEFENKEIFEVVRSNWPHLYNHSKLNGVVDLEHHNSPEELALLRKNGIMSLQMFSDDCYFSPGGGYTSTGDNLLDIDSMNKVGRLLKQLQTHIDDVTEHFFCTTEPGLLPNPLTLKLFDVAPDHAIVLEPITQRRLPVRY